ncbi:MAG: hypothetical protein RR036_00095 [Oscillospiraceae bacterium]
MDDFVVKRKTPIVLRDYYEYSGIAFDGCTYYLTLRCGPIILKLDKCFRVTGKIKTCRKYSSITYDCTSKCFWAISANFCKLYKLNCCLDEVDCLLLKLPGTCVIMPIGVCYDCCDDSLLVATSLSVMRVEKTTGQTTVLKKYADEIVLGIACISPYYLVSTLKTTKQKLYLLDTANQVIIKKAFDTDFLVTSMVANFCTFKDGILDIVFLTQKSRCYPYLVETELDALKNHLTFCECNTQINCCHCDTPSCKPHACTDIIESIALVEASISHILNAEGEKIQKIVASTDDIDKIICVNKEVNKTIINATHLEHILYAKLEAIKDCCDLDCDTDCDCDIDCDVDCGCDPGCEGDCK